MILCSIDLSDFINEMFSVKVNKNHFLQAGHEIDYKKYWAIFYTGKSNFLQRKI